MRIEHAFLNFVDEAIAPGAAERQLRAWAEQFAPLPERVYRLRDLGPAAFHDWGGVHVLVGAALALVVAADD